MDRLNIIELEQESARKLKQASYDPKKLALIHAGVSLAATLLLAVMHLLLSKGISNTGGLSGIGARTTLESVQYILQLTSSLVLPFWEMGFIYCALVFSKGQSAEPRDLTAGFQRIGPLLRFWLMQGLIYFAVVFAALQICSLIYAISPFSSNMMLLMEQLLNDPAFMESGAISQEMTQQIFQGLLPVYILTGVLSLVLIIPIAYRLRMTPYRIFDTQQPRALMAMNQSRLMMKGNCKALFKLDLHFWWYYLLQVLVVLVSNLDLLLPRVGIALPISEDGALLVFLGVHILLSLLLAWCLRSRVETVYACAYQQLLPKTE